MIPRIGAILNNRAGFDRQFVFFGWFDNLFETDGIGKIEESSLKTGVGMKNGFSFLVKSDMSINLSGGDALMP